MGSCGSAGALGDRPPGIVGGAPRPGIVSGARPVRGAAPILTVAVAGRRWVSAAGTWGGSRLRSGGYLGRRVSEVRQQFGDGGGPAPHAGSGSSTPPGQTACREAGVALVSP
ncbi:hypothetical protein Pen02_55400 [Plantactinospora endophytica]|uniref:Uncharacterized protein n=1 Tax=Plantactinospora endophytica TaxID=673535 RepID=A0ABQ4E7H4_9ACTN|nr:hypothetical protein Pen02_55400 [Plantactinospora endophytica]